MNWGQGIPASRTGKKRVSEEDIQQELLFSWIDGQIFITRKGEKKPLLNMCWSTPNGGFRGKREAAALVRQGVKSGVFDVTIAIAAGGYHGLFIEMKHGNNTLEDSQREFKQNMEEEGYFCVVCYCAADAIMEIEFYINGGKEGPIVGISVVEGPFKFKAVCRSMELTFKTMRGAVGWLGRRCFGEDGERI